MRLPGLVVGCALALVMTAPVPAQGGQWTCDEPLTIILGGGNPTPGTYEPQFRVIDNRTDWCLFWDQVLGVPPYFPAPPCDTSRIDFATHAAVVVGLGWGPNLCYSMEITCASRRGHSGNLDIEVTETVPGPSCRCQQAVINLLQVLRIERPVRRVQLTQEVEYLSCPRAGP